MGKQTLAFEVASSGNHSCTRHLPMVSLFSPDCEERDEETNEKRLELSSAEVTMEAEADVSSFLSSSREEWSCSVCSVSWSKRRGSV
jgi:hypothetical protein